LSRREADVAVRLVRPTEPTLVARKAGVMTFALLASRAYLDRHPALRSAADLAAHDFIGFEEQLDSLPQIKWLKRTTGLKDPRFAIRANTTSTQLAACEAGQGIALLPTFIATSLVRILPRLNGPVREIFTAFHGDLRKNARLTTTLRWLHEVLR